MIEINDVLLSPEQLQQHGIRIAENHRLSSKEKTAVSLKGRLKKNYDEIFNIYKNLNKDIKEDIYLTPPCEWLLDNFYIIENQVKSIYHGLSRERTQKLKVLDNNNFKGILRIYALSLEMVSHSDGRIDEKLILDFLEAYQTRKTLTIAELWVLPLMLVIALIENINIISKKVENSQSQLRIIKEWEGLEKEHLFISIKKHIETKKSIHPILAEFLVKILKKNSIHNKEFEAYLLEKLEKREENIEDIIQQSYHQQAARKVSIGNSITSIHTIENLNWNNIVEKLSVVERILRMDPAGIYSRMDFESRDYYRREIIAIAKECGVAESYVAKKAIDCAKNFADKNVILKRKHVGFYLIDSGKKQLYNSLGKKNRVVIVEKLSSYTLPIFISIAFLATLLGIYGYFKYMENNPSVANGVSLSGFIILLSLIPLSDISIGLYNWLHIKNTKPRFVPKLTFPNGIGEENATLIVMPTLLSDPEDVEGTINQLEVHYLSNRDENFYFAIAGDFIDGDREHLSQDQEILDRAKIAIEHLNKKYEKNPFLYFHRHRIKSETQNRWMGWERKRGALIELNNLLRGEKNTSYSYIVGDLSKLSKIKYVITLDRDTILPIEEGKKLVGAIAHPLHQPIINTEKNVVVEGYGLIQPRISLDIKSVNKTYLSRIFAGQGGIDPYTTAISDVYQDLFGEGIFTGKGIYHIDTFRKCLGDSLPTNSILSHDLLEGSYLRTGLASDIQLIDGYPSNYNSYMARLHRWVRGDWQLIQWLSNWVIDGKGKRVKNPINSISKWKILDNLRRSLVSTFNLAFIILALLFFPGNIFVWLVLPLFSIFFPTILGIFNLLTRKDRIIARERFNGNMVFGLKASLYQSLLSYIFLVHHSYVMMDAIIRTLYRVKISNKNLLEWKTAAEVEKDITNDTQGYFIRMKWSFLTSILFIFFSLWANPLRFSIAIILSLPWLFSPFIAKKVSEEKVLIEDIRKEDKIVLDRLCRKMWAYYEDFAGEQDNFLPPDNYQVEPHNGIAHRTSPTNIGFLLMAILSAKDFGYITILEMLKKIKDTLTTIKKLKTWNGHLYNWYDTQSLEVLNPHYISTVDSGNFIAYLMTLKAGLKECLNSNLININNVKGLASVLRLSRVKDSGIIKNIIDKSEEESISLQEWIDLLELADTIECSDEYWYKKLIILVNESKYLLRKFFPKILLNKRKTLDKEVINSLDFIQKNNSLLDLEISYKELRVRLINLDQNENRTIDLDIKEIIKDLEGCLENIDQVKNNIYDYIMDVKNIIKDTDFSQLYSEERQLFSIGYNAQEEKLTDSYYDLLASEARIISYLAIVQGKVPKKHWFKLSRPLTKVNGYQSLVSWTGTMFEYLMPPLIMNHYENTLLSETYKTAVAAQIKYGRERKVPWGTSESGYYAFDLSLNYQYKAFGVPELGLKRGLKTDMVVSPYSSLLALPIAPIEAMNNIYDLIGSDLEGKYGLYEAVDYTVKRLPRGRNKMIIMSFMAHHQGMGIMVLNNMLNDNIMKKRFHSHPVIKAGESLLQEKVPLGVITTKDYKEEIQPMDQEDRKVNEVDIERIFEWAPEEPPHYHILTNGFYQVMITTLGTGFSRAGDMQITRWREGSHNNYGNFIFIKNLKNNKIWSTTERPIGKKTDKYRVVFSEDKGEFIRKDDNIECHTEIVISTEHPVEIRKLTITNHETLEQELEVTSYLELVLAPQSADIAHPAFNNLFVRTEKMEGIDGIMASRRPRGDFKKENWYFHILTIDGKRIGNFEYETSRNNFIGRARVLSNAEKLHLPLDNSIGAVLDPIISLRSKVKVPAQDSITLTFVNGIGDTKEQVRLLALKYSEPLSVKQAFQLSKIRNQIQVQNLDMSLKEIILYQDMLSHILKLSPLRRKLSDYLKQNAQGQNCLWAYGISGDLPIVLISVSAIHEMDMVEQIIKAHKYLRTKGLKVDLILLNEDESSYYQPLEEMLKEEIFNLGCGDLINQYGGLFILNANILPEEDYILLLSVARFILRSDEENITKQLKIDNNDSSLPPIKKFTTPIENYPLLEEEEKDLFFYNGYGGFTRDGDEYIIELKDNLQTPTPWINVISNPDFGFQVSENGSGFTWAENSRENKLTPWSNDPTSDPISEVIYIRDEEDGRIWSPTGLPIRDQGKYSIHHGWGYSEFYHDSHGINQNLIMYVPLEESIKINLLKLHNHSDKERRLSLTYYIRPVMGVDLDITLPFILTDWNKEGQCILIKNPYNTEYPHSIVGLSCSEEIISYTGDNEEFLGNQGSLVSPKGLMREALSNRVGGGLDPCGAIQIDIKLQPNEKKSIGFLLSYGKDIEEIKSLLAQHKDIEYLEKILRETKNYWRNLLGKVKVSTPDVSMDYLLNGWLLYQAIACRLWARSAFYQSGGAYGFRDQLQDTMNILPIFPQASREQILINCAHQFLEGDVQHWWHPGAEEKGIRTRFTDDLLWLPLCVTEYIEQTEDYSILLEEVPYLEEEPLEEGQDERYGVPRISEYSGTVYEHCIRAIDRGLKFGEHGIPLMGSGDWNDGMSTVGNKGKGESIWLGWFIYLILNRFIPLCELKKDTERAENYKRKAEYIRENIESNGWDGNWYRRAYFDDGTPLGSIENDECMIDSLAQSWAIISGGGSKERSRRAMNAVEQHLVKKNEGLILLFTPPFDDGELKPGYIKGYVPGVRENGGQYTHGATWVINALAMLGEGEKAVEYFNLINPINHSRTQIECATYKVEPYVMAADVYAVSPHIGRGGWTWYTGAAGWMYTVGIKYILGLQPRGDKLYINPCIPKEWKEYKLSYRYGNSRYIIRVLNPHGLSRGVANIKIDGKSLRENYIPLREDKKQYEVEVVINKAG